MGRHALPLVALCYFSAKPKTPATRTMRLRRFINRYQTARRFRMATSRREKMSAVDTAWLRMDRPANLMMICGVLLFDDRIALARLKATIDERFLRFARFRERPVQTPSGAYWQSDEAFDLDRHVIEAKLPPGDATRALQTFVSRLANRSLDAARPLWQFHLIENFGRGSAIVLRIHHCYADGIALIQVMLSLTDAGRDGPPAMAPPPARRVREPPADDALSQLMAPVANVMQAAIKVSTTVIEKGVELWQNPVKALELAEKGTSLTAEVAKLALMAQDSPTRFKGTPAASKKVAWADPLSLADVKAVGKALGASVNDVLLSCVAGALRGYLVRKRDDVDGVMIRALVPVNLRPLDKAYHLGNQFGLVFLELPIGIENPIERLYAVRANMRALKGSYQPILSLGLLAAMGAGPKVLQEQLLDALARNATAVMTNVPGPQQPLYLAGARMESLMFWVPQSGDIGMGVSILSYNGEVQFGLITDRGLVPDPQRVIEGFAPEFEKLVLTALLAPPWHGDLDPAVAADAVAS
jgi:diacylglycerol O-acyltransferase / wax synthase